MLILSLAPNSPSPSPPFFPHSLISLSLSLPFPFQSNSLAAESNTGTRTRFESVAWIHFPRYQFHLPLLSGQSSISIFFFLLILMLIYQSDLCFLIQCMKVSHIVTVQFVRSICRVDLLCNAMQYNTIHCRFDNSISI